ncbi:MAG: hypothetical protein MJB57_13990 [Gemmatimonadetes bacterium]|nr:hypothetical protein [Gemmatimonadota bacterium]
MNEEPRTAPLIDWLLAHDLLRGPFAFSDYWSNVLDLRLGNEPVDSPWVDRTLFRVALDRPDLELPRRRFYFLMYLVGPLLLPFRRLRRLGRYRVRFRREIGDSVMRALEPFRLSLEMEGPGRVTARAGGADGEVLGRDLLDPRVVAGFTSLFLATYKLAIASLISILLVAIAGPWLITTGRLDAVIDAWIPIGFPLVALVLALLLRDWVTGLLGALPIVFGRFLVGVLGDNGGWLPFAAALVGLYALYIVVDWLFVPRPVPPALMLYRSGADGQGYGGPEDAPYWLEGDAYWVWRYLMLSPAELNKFWERDWERIEIWIRADGPTAGQLEWVVTDAHYRELWIPLENLGAADRIGRQRERAATHARSADPGLWLVEVDAHPVFHSPYVRTVTFIPERDEVHVQSLGHLMSALFARRRRDDPDDYIPALDRLRIDTGREILGDLPEVIAHLTARVMLASPWRYWRYPLGAQRRRERRLYDAQPDEGPPPASDPRMQIKA